MTNQVAGMILAALVLQTSGSACAGSVSIDVAPNRRTLHVEAADATIAEVLGKLHALQSFDLEQQGADLDGGKISGSLNGPASAIIEQILVGTNFILYTNPRTRDVERVVVMAPRATAPAGNGVAVPPAVPVEDLPKKTGNIVLPAQISPSPSATATHAHAIARPPLDEEPAMSSRRLTRKAAGSNGAIARARRRA